LWKRRLRWFFVATSGLFGYADGIEWGVSHFRMKVAA
jgi:cyclopropane-fatty-acyl-phospholipid synthase